MDAAAELGRNPVSNHQNQPEYGNEQADAGRDCRVRLARPNSQARTRTGKYSFFLFSWPRAGLATLPGRSILLLYVLPYMDTTVCTYLLTRTFDRYDMTCTDRTRERGETWTGGEGERVDGLRGR